MFDKFGRRHPLHALDCFAAAAQQSLQPERVSEAEQVCVKPAGAKTARNRAVHHRAISVNREHHQTQEQDCTSDVLCFQVKGETGAAPCDQVQLRQNCRVSDEHRGHAATSRVQECL